ncbi:FAD-dependent oxidoreductase [Marinospirillum sp.]|nr:FAD-dependent oxidoreductase [Marinospirillum sp.]
MKNIAVIGGGITGITTAYALLKRGHRVTVYERHR